MCESRCNCSVFSFLFTRHLAAATLFFSREAFRLSSSGLPVWSWKVVVLFRPLVFLCLGVWLSSGGVKGFFPCALPRLRFFIDCSDVALARSRPFLEASLVAEFDLGGVTCPYSEIVEAALGRFFVLRESEATGREPMAEFLSDCATAAFCCCTCGRERECRCAELYFRAKTS